LRAVRSLKIIEKLVFVSTSECYGKFQPQNKTLTEEQPFNPRSPYAISKAAAEFTCCYYANRFGVPVTIARSFNHCGPRQNVNFAIPSFAQQIARIEKRYSKPIIYVGNLSVKRDLSDVRDIVHGYRLLAEKGKPGRAYHFCSGKAVSIKSILNQLLKMSSCEIEIKIDPSRFRKNDIPIMRGDNSRAVKELGYNSRYHLRTTLKDTIDYWRNKVVK
ncbi:MAG: GDP-mannose 4,6-dehydratase, partial [Candidatus Zixiibacteriota bacterium]